MATLALAPTLPERPADLIRVAVPRLNKLDWISEYLPQLEARDYDLNWARVVARKTLTCAEWNEFMGALLNDRDWLAGLGGASSWAFADMGDERGDFLSLSEPERDLWRATSFLLVVAVSCGGQTIYIDPEGYDYARYVAFSADGLPEGKTREELRRERAKAEAERLQAEKKARIANEIANPPAIPADHGLKFLWNGIKVKGKLYRAWYSLGNLHHYPADTITVSARDYHSFPAEVRACFHVENETDLQSDYFDSDRLRICSSHPLYGLAKAAYGAHEAHFEKLREKKGR
jgi:hypothetical protein